MIAAKTHMHMFVIMSEYRLHECCTIASISLACTSNGHIYIYLYILREYIYIMHIHICIHLLISINENAYRLCFSCHKQVHGSRSCKIYSLSINATFIGLAFISSNLFNLFSAMALALAE